MEPLKGYDAWKTRAPDPGHQALPETGYSRTRMLWWRSYRLAQRHGTLPEWLDEQRQYPAFASFVREAEGKLARWRDDEEQHDGAAADADDPGRDA